MINADQFKAAMRQFASGITVLTWNAPDGSADGITVSAFSSLSLTPPLVLFCIDRGAYIYPELAKQEHLSINILAAEQTDIACRFAGADRSGLEQLIHFNNGQNQAMLNGALANLLVKIRSRIEGGDHDIFIAEVHESTVHENRTPLLYHNSRIFSV